jgi:pyruvate kinase
MDLAGPKIRTGDIRLPDHGKKAHRGDLIAIARLGQLDAIDLDDRLCGRMHPGGGA